MFIHVYVVTGLLQAYMQQDITCQSFWSSVLISYFVLKERQLCEYTDLEKIHD